MGFMSGLSGGVFHQLILLSSINFWVSLLVCFGSLSCWNLWPSGNVSRIKGIRLLLRRSSVKKVDSIIPPKTARVVAPRLDIPAQTWTLYGCFGLPFSFGGSHQRRNDSFRLLSIATVHSSVKITLSNVSPSSWHFRANAKRLARFGSLTNWQYFVPADSHPRVFRALLIVARDTVIPNLCCNSCCKSGAVISSFASYDLSMNCWMTGDRILDGRTVLGSLAMEPRCWKRIRKFLTACLVQEVPQVSRRSLTIATTPFLSRWSFKILHFCIYR